MLKRLGIALLVALLALPARASDLEGRISQRDSYRIGSAGVLCTAQRRSEDAHYRSLFDRAYDIACRDAAAPIGTLYVLRRPGGAVDAALPDLTDKQYRCRAPASAGNALPGGRRVECVDPDVGLNHTLYAWRRGDSLYVAEGISAYDSALRLGIRSLITDRPASGEVQVAATLSGDPAALARLQAERLDATQALAAAYGHANDGAYIEAAQFFDTLVDRSRVDPLGNQRRVEYLANLAMDQSVLGNRVQAERLFEQAQRAGAENDPEYGRLFRNLKAMHLLSGHDPTGALAVLDAPLGNGAASKDYPRERIAQGYIDRPLSQRLSLDDVATSHLSGSSNTPLTAVERATLLDAQAMYLRAVALRLTGDRAGARRWLPQSLAAYLSVRGGNVVSMAWLPAGIATERAVIDGDEHDRAGEEAGLRHAIDILTLHFPDTAALLGAQARLAAWQAANGHREEAIASYRALVKVAASVPDGTEALREWIGAYFDALVASADQPGRAEDFFAASQLLVRPGVAQTQTVLARQFSAGSDEASELFRQSINLSREVISLDSDIARLGALDTRTVADDEALAAAKVRRTRAALIQTQLVAKLAAYPKYRVVNNDGVSLAELRKALRGDEAYYKLILVKDAAYALLVRPDGARIFRLAANAAELEKLSNAIRDSIVRSQDGQLVTDPFDLAAARRMYVLLFGPAQADVARVHHLIFEPDGPLLKLPATLLVTDQAGVDAYAARQKAASADPFDFTGVAWLGRSRIVSTSVSPHSFVEVRAIAPSTAARTYIGFGQNTPARDSPLAPSPTAPRDACDWPLATWNNPVSGAGLTMAERELGGAGDEVVTRDGFTDVALRQRGDLSQFRVIEFATHGLVTAPHPGCPARPALVTSFGRGDSDGLLSFREIFDLRLNADTVVLSACDTAGAATAAATREAGITTGGNFALDGLVRAFVGAGARSVIASHWPVPDDFHATERLISGMYTASATLPVGEAMRRAQLALMDDPVTSHPYYWAAFAIVGDAAKPLTSR